MRKNRQFIDFEELPKRVQHALEIEVEWHSVLVYEIRKGMYGFYILDKYMPTFADFTGLIKSEYAYNNEGFIQKSVQKVIDTTFSGMRCRYFPKGCLSSTSLEIEILDLCLFKFGLGFSIELHCNDYGFIDGEKSKAAPAYVHVLDEDELEIGLLNITGPCPKKISDITEFRPPVIFKKGRRIKVTPLMKHRKNLIRWANNNFMDGLTRWGFAQEMWERIREGKR
jgi:hypothetical protein